MQAMATPAPTAMPLARTPTAAPGPALAAHAAPTPTITPQRPDATWHRPARRGPVRPRGGRVPRLAWALAWPALLGLLGATGPAHSAGPTTALSGQPCELGTLQGSACVLGRVVATREIHGSGPLGIAAGAKAVADADADFFSLADLEASSVHTRAALLPRRTDWGPAALPAERQFAEATRWALLGDAERANQALGAARQAQALYRQQVNPAQVARIGQADALAYQVHAAVVAYHRGERAAAVQGLAAAARAMPASVAVHETGGPLTRADALRHWLHATWDIGPVFEVASTLDDAERVPLLADALAIATLVPRQREAAARLVDMARLVAQRQGQGALAMWAVRAAADCADQMAQLVPLDGLSPVPISPGLHRALTSQRLMDADALRTAVSGLFSAWRQHHCQRTLPHHHLALTAAWIDTHRTLAQLKAASPKPDELWVQAPLGHAAALLAEVAADLRSPARVREALALSDGITLGLRTAAYLGFMGSGREVAEWALATRLNIAQDLRGHTAAAAALGAAFGHTYSRRLPAPAVAEGVAGDPQPCAVPVFATRGAVQHGQPAARAAPGGAGRLPGPGPRARRPGPGTGPRPGRRAQRAVRVSAGADRGRPGLVADARQGRQPAAKPAGPGPR